MDSLHSDVEKHCSKQILKDNHDDHRHPYHYQEQQLTIIISITRSPHYAVLLFLD